MDPVTLVAVITCAHSVTRLTDALARRLEAATPRTQTPCDQAVPPQQNPAHRSRRRTPR